MLQNVTHPFCFVPPLWMARDDAVNGVRGAESVQYTRALNMPFFARIVVQQGLQELLGPIPSGEEKNARRLEHKDLML